MMLISLTSEIFSIEILLTFLGDFTVINITVASLEMTLVLNRTVEATGNSKLLIIIMAKSTK